MEAGTILVVDGDDDVRALIQAALEDEGYRVALAARGEGVACAQRARPSLILLDLDDPPASEGGAGAPLRAEAAALRIPVVVLSDAPEPEDSPVDGWLTKPFDLDALYGLARRWAR